MISGGSAGTRSHDHSPNSASQTWVNTRARSSPPCARMNAAAAAHVLGLGRVAGQAQRPVGLDRRRQLAGAAVEVRPGAVLALLGADPGGRALGLIGAADAEELAQEHVLGVHRHVRLQLALPPAGLVLQGQQVLARALQRHAAPRCGASTVDDADMPES